MNIRDKYGMILVPMVTPFKDNQEVDCDSAIMIAEKLIEDGQADSLILSGTTGEFHTMSYSERVHLFEVMMDAVGNRIPLIAGTGCTSTVESVALTKKAEDLGYELVMVVAPYYAKPNQQEITEHFQTIAANTNVPIMLYNIPIFAGVNIEPSTVAKLSEVDNIVGIKEEAELNAKQITDFLNATPDEFIVYCGDDTMILEALAQGGSSRIGGIVSGAAHIMGKDIRRMITSFLQGDIDKAAQMQRRHYKLFRAMGQSNRTNPVALLKEAMKMMGYPAGVPRSPLSPGTTEEIAAVRAVMEDLRLV